SFEPAIDQLDGVYLYDVDDLEGVIADNKGSRASEAVQAERIVDGEVDMFCRWLDGLDVVPTVVELRERIEQIRDREFARYLASVGDSLGPRHRDAVERLTRAIVNEILHAPLSELRRRGATADVVFVETLRGLFRLDADRDDDDDAE